MYICFGGTWLESDLYPQTYYRMGLAETLRNGLSLFKYLTLCVPGKLTSIKFKLSQVLATFQGHSHI